MKKGILFVLIITLLSIGTASSQLTIESTGRATVGTAPLYGDDPDNMLTMSIQGNHGLFNGGSKLGFGDFGRYCLNGWNVFIGEFGSTDTDILWLHGKKGLKMTAQKSNYLIADWTYPNGGLPRYTFYTGVRSDRLAISSDDSHKSSIINIPLALPRLVQLRGIQYTYNSIDNTISVGDTGQCPSRGSESLTGKEAEDSALMASLSSLRDQGDFRYGLRTSDLLNYFPDVIEYDESGNEYINYIEMIPVIISAIWDLYHSLATQGITIDIVEEYENYLRTTQTDSNSADGQMYATGRLLPRLHAASATLYQNTPNPFTSTTEIQYYIPTEATNAELYIFNLAGELLQAHAINSFGNGSVTIGGSTLNAGMYVYSLVVDNELVDTKRMILTK